MSNVTRARPQALPSSSTANVEARRGKEPLALPPWHWLRGSRFSLLAAVTLFLVAFLAAAWVSDSIFEKLPHSEDELAYLFQARTLASGRLVAPAPALPHFFDAPFIVVHDGMWFGKYPPGYPAVLALGVLAGQPWLLNPLFAGASALLTFLLGSRLYGRRTGLLAGLLLVGSPFFLLQGGSFLSHVVGLALTLAALLSFEALSRTGSPRAALGVGLALGVLFLSRPMTAVGIGIPLGIWFLYQTVRRRRLRPTVLAAAVGFLPFVAMFLAYNALSTGSPTQTGYELWWPYDRIGFGEGIGTGGRHTLEAGWLNTRVSLEDLAGYLFGWPAGLSLVPAALASALLLPGLLAKLFPAGHSMREASRGEGEDHPWPDGRRAWWDLLLLAVFGSLVGVYAAYWTPGTLYGPRYYFEAMGALALLSARGIIQAAAIGQALLGWIAPARPQLRRWPYLAVLLVVAGLFAHAFTHYTPQQLGRHVHWYDVDGSGLRMVESMGLKNAVVFVERGYWTEYAPFFSENVPTLDSPVVYAVDAGDDANRALMALYPGRSFYRYADGRVAALPAP